MKFAIIATVLSLISMSPMRSAKNLEKKVNELEQENCVLKTSYAMAYQKIMELHEKVDQLSEQNKETRKVLQELTEKTIFDDIVKEFDRVYDLATSFFTTSTTTESASDANDDEVSTTTIPSKSYEEELAPPEPPNHVFALDPTLFLALSLVAGSPSQQHGAFGAFGETIFPTTETLSSFYCMGSELLQQAVHFLKNYASVTQTWWCHGMRAAALHIAPALLFLEEQWGMPRVFTIAFYVAGMWCAIMLVSSFCLYRSSRKFVFDLLVHCLLMICITIIQATLFTIITIGGNLIAFGQSSLQQVNGIVMNAFGDLQHKPLSAIYMGGTALCLDLYERTMSSLSVTKQAIVDKVKHLFGHVEPQHTIVIRQAETVMDIASTFGWLHVIDYLALDPSRYAALCMAYIDIDCFFDACLEVVGLTYDAKRNDVVNQWNLLVQRVRNAGATNRDIRFAHRLVNKLQSMFGGGTSVGTLKEQIYTMFSNALKTCPIEELPTVLLHIKEFLLLPHWPTMAMHELSKLEQLEQKLRQSFIDQAISEMEQFLERIKAIFGITDLRLTNRRHVERNRNRRRLVHHPDKGGCRAYYDFLDNVMDFLNEQWFTIDDERVNMWILAEVTKHICITRMQACSISELEGVLAGMRPWVSMPNESEHLQLVVVR